MEEPTVTVGLPSAYEHEAARLLNDATHPRCFGFMAERGEFQDELEYDRTTTIPYGEDGLVMSQTVRVRVITILRRRDA